MTDRCCRPLLVHEEDVDALLARELNAMSDEDRKELFEGIHGVDDCVQEETGGMIAECLEQLESSIGQLHHKPAYEKALAVDNGAYVCNRDFRLQFLRAEHFDPKRAADRLVSFMEQKLRSFGPAPLARTIRFDDLDDLTKHVLESGMLQMLPRRDNMGRAVLVDLMNAAHGPQRRPPAPKDPIFAVKAMFYMAMAASEDEETQRRGLVLVPILMPGLGTQLINLDCVRKTADALHGICSWFPLRIKCAHVCVHRELTEVRWHLEVLRSLVGRDLRARLRVHVGSYHECCETLWQFGIPRDSLPINLHGDSIHKSNHSKWLLRRRIKDLANHDIERMLGGGVTAGATSRSSRKNQYYGGDCGETVAVALGATNLSQVGSPQPGRKPRMLPQVVDLPTRKDVLLGRGRTHYDHEGNVMMRQLVRELLEGATTRGTTECATRRRDVAIEVCQRIYRGGRFLEKDASLGWWVEVSISEAQSRVSACIRTYLNKKWKRENSS